jgi:hypothetical protein
MVLQAGVALLLQCIRLSETAADSAVESQTVRCVCVGGGGVCERKLANTQLLDHSNAAPLPNLTSPNLTYHCCPPAQQAAASPLGTGRPGRIYTS